MPNDGLHIQFTTLIWVAGAILISLTAYLIIRLRRTERKKAEVESRLKILEEKVGLPALRAVESQLNPHLFKNILNSIQSHAYQTYYALDKLANVLDYILYESRNKFVSVKEEIEFALNLIEINKVKVSPLFELKVKSRIDENAPLYSQRLLAPLISVDLIENAFKHADLQSGDAFISIVFEFMDNAFQLTVSNKISPKTFLKKENSGIGTQTLEERLHALHKNRFKLERFTEGDVYMARLKIELSEQEATMLTA